MVWMNKESHYKETIMKQISTNIVDGKIVDHLLLVVNVSYHFEPGCMTISDFYRMVAEEFNRIADEEEKLPEDDQANNNVDSDLVEIMGSY